MTITGNKVEIQTLKKEEDENWYENRILKPIPNFGGNFELKTLAQNIQSEILTTNPNVKFSDIIGLEETKNLLKEAVLLPMKYPELFDRELLTPWRGVLL